MVVLEFNVTTWKAAESGRSPWVQDQPGLQKCVLGQPKLPDETLSQTHTEEQKKIKLIKWNSFWRNSFFVLAGALVGLTVVQLAGWFLCEVGELRWQEAFLLSWNTWLFFIRTPDLFWFLTQTQKVLRACPASWMPSLACLRVNSHRISQLPFITLRFIMKLP